MRAPWCRNMAMDQRHREGVQGAVHGSMNESLARHVAPYVPLSRFLGGVIHFFSDHLILARKSAQVTRAAGFRLVLRPTVFHPRYFLSSECFAKFIDNLDLSS